MALICQPEGSEKTIRLPMAHGKSEAEVLRNIAHDIPMERAGKPEEL